MQINWRIVKCSDMQILHFSSQNSEPYLSHVFLPLTVAKLSTHKNSPVFWPTLYCMLLFMLVKHQSAKLNSIHLHLCNSLITTGPWHTMSWMWHMIQQKLNPLTVEMNIVSLSDHTIHHSQSDFAVPPHLKPAFLELFCVAWHPQWWTTMTCLQYNHCFWDTADHCRHFPMLHAAELFESDPNLE